MRTCTLYRLPSLCEWGHNSFTRTHETFVLLFFCITLRNNFNRLTSFYLPASLSLAITHTRSYLLRLKSTTFTATSLFLLKRTCVFVFFSLCTGVSGCVCQCVGVILNIRFFVCKFSEWFGICIPLLKSHLAYSLIFVSTVFVYF